MFPPSLGWGLSLSVIVLAVAIYFGLSPVLQGPASQTYCYEKVETFSSAGGPAECFTVSGERFAAVFAPDAPAVGATERLAGVAIPGLWDGHGHLLPYGEFLHSADLFGSSSAEEVRARLHAYVDAHPGAGGKDEWLRGVGWDQMALGQMPTAVSCSTVAVLSGPY